MQITIKKSTLKEIQPFRLLFLQENNFQIRFNACHERNMSDSYLIAVDDMPIGYGSIKGREQLNDRNAIFEYYLIPPYRKMSHTIFSELIAVSKAKYIECQSNILFLTSLLYQFCQNIHSDAILFADHAVTEYSRPEVVFRTRKESDDVF